MDRRTALKVVGATLVGSGVSRKAGAAEVIKIGTLAPMASPWAQVFKTWAAAVTTKSGGAVTLQFTYNGGQGDEAAMVAKMKAGQLDGAAVTGAGLGKIYKPILALQMPGLFPTWAKLDAARDAMKATFEKGASDAGVQIIGWGDVGMRRLLSKSFAIKAPDNLKGQKPYLWRDDESMAILYQVIGGITPVPLNVPEVQPQLATGAVNAVLASCLGAEQLKWTDKLDTLTDLSFGAEIGAITISAKRLSGLSEDQRTIVMDTGKIAASALTKKIRDEDSASLARLKSKMTVVSPSADEQGKWDAIWKQTRQKLAQGTFPADIVAKLETFA